MTSVSTNPAATQPPNDAQARTNQEKNRQNEKDYTQSLEETLKKYNLGRYVNAFKDGDLNMDTLMSMDKAALHDLEDNIIRAATLKRKNFQKFIQIEIMPDYQSEYLKNNSNSNSVTSNNNSNNNNNNNNNNNYIQQQQQHDQKENSSNGSQNYAQYGQYGQNGQNGRYVEQGLSRGRIKKWYCFVENANGLSYFREYSPQNQILCDEMWQKLHSTNRNQHSTIRTFKKGNNGTLTQENATIEMIISNNRIDVYHIENGTRYRIYYEQADAENRLFGQYKCSPEITPLSPSVNTSKLESQDSVLLRHANTNDTLPSSTSRLQ